jgi:outer membrane murein-binding lipoprotein Lpp
MFAQSASYNLFNYVNEVNAEVEALEDSIDKVRAEIEAHLEQVSGAFGAEVRGPVIEA